MTIRQNDGDRCPFGLPIPQACENVGPAIERMAPENDSEKIGKANRIVYVYHKTCEKCPYADKILKKFGKVDCDFGDTGEGEKSVPLAGSPVYPNTFGSGIQGLYGYPLGWYSDSNQSRNMFFGLFSLLGGQKPEHIIKLAEKYDECGESEKADIIDDLLKKLNDIREEYGEAFDQLRKYIEENRDEYEKVRNDNGMFFGLMKKWLGPRQINR